MVKWPLPVRIPRLRALEPPQIVVLTFRTSSEVAKTCDVEPFRILVLERDLGDAADASALGPVEIGRLLPHRYPMLLLDRVQHLSSTTARGYKTVSANEPWCSAPGGRLPSTLVIEAMAQLGGLLIITPADYGQKMAHLAGITRARFRGAAYPGDRLQMNAELLRLRGKTGWVSVSAHVDQRPICSAQLAYTLFAVNPLLRCVFDSLVPVAVHR